MPSKLQLAKLHHFFNILDYNRNGILQEGDFTEVGINMCEVLGIEKDSEKYADIIDRSKRLFKQMLHDMGLSNQSEIPLDKWIEFFTTYVYNTKDTSHLKNYILLITLYVFDVFDQNNDGTLSVDEYIDMFTIYHIDVKYSAKSFVNLDVDKNSYISKRELLNAVTEYFISNDPKSEGNWLFGNWEEN